MQARPISLSDDQLQTIMECAAPLQPRDRSAFLEAVAAQLRGKELGDGLVGRVCREVAATYYRAPTIMQRPPNLSRRLTG
jgi:hypothetical protein